MGIGQAAGAAAAQCIADGDIPVNKIDTDRLRDTLIAYGANLTH